MSIRRTLLGCGHRAAADPRSTGVRVQRSPQGRQERRTRLHRQRTHPGRGRELSGLGNGDVLVTLTATGQPDLDLHQPRRRQPATRPEPRRSGPHRHPGHPAGGDQERHHTLRRRTNPPVTPIPGAPDCPNPQWTENITDVAFTSATITVEQPPGTTVLTVSCTFTPAEQRRQRVGRNSVLHQFVTTTAHRRAATHYTHPARPAPAGRAERRRPSPSPSPSRSDRPSPDRLPTRSTAGCASPEHSQPLSGDQASV